jgi:hypothetical protein
VQIAQHIPLANVLQPNPVITAVLALDNPKTSIVMNESDHSPHPTADALSNIACGSFGAAGREGLIFRISYQSYSFPNHPNPTRLNTFCR